MSSKNKYAEEGEFTHDGELYDLGATLRESSDSVVSMRAVSDLSWLLRHVSPDEKRVAAADTSAPVMIAPDSKGRHTVVDGLHRLVKAVREGHAHIPGRDAILVKKACDPAEELATAHKGGERALNYLTRENQVMLKASSHYAALRSARAATNTEPTEGQKHAGNYAKGELTLHGMRIKLENPKGSYRSGKDKSGTPWRNLMHADYGYFAGTKAVDGDAVDCFIGPDLKSEFVAAIDQYAGDKFDETKFVLATSNKDEASRLYLKHYPKGWKLGPVTSTTVHALKDWLKSDQTKKPFAGQMQKAAAKWRDPSVLKSIIKSSPEYFRAFNHDGNIARTRQMLGQMLHTGYDPLAARAPGWALGQDIGSYRSRLERGALRRGAPKDGRMNFSRAEPLGSDKDSSRSFFSRIGTPIESAHGKTPEQVMGDKIYRGGFGVDPWGGGYYGGALTHGTPSRSLAYRYGRGNAGVGMVQHYQAAPNQLAGPDFSLEFALLKKRPSLSGIASPRGEAEVHRVSPGQPIDPEGAHYESPIKKDLNPYVGTELFIGDQSKFVHANDAAGQAALKNYAENMTAKFPGTQEFLEGRQWNTLPTNPRLNRLALENQPAFNILMQRRADRTFT